MRYVLDINFILDAITNRSVNKLAYFAILENCILNYTAYISASSLHHIRFIIKRNYSDIYDKYLLLEEKLKIAKLPSYIDKSNVLYEDDIEDYLVELSAIAIDGKVITSDSRFLKRSKYAISPKEYILTHINKSSKLKIDFANLKKQYFAYQPKIEKEMDNVLNNASFIMGNAIKELEEELSHFTGAKHAITCSSGTDALLLAMMALNIGPSDEKIFTIKCFNISKT